MHRRWAIVVALAGLGLAVFLAVALAPDTGPALGSFAPADPVAAPIAAPIAALARSAPSRPTRTGSAPLEARPSLPPRAPDPTLIHAADSRGLAAATVERRAGLVSCWQQFLDRTDSELDVTGRFTVQVTLRSDSPRVETHVTNAPDDAELGDCVDATLADARFEAPTAGTVTLLVPIPMSPGR